MVALMSLKMNIAIGIFALEAVTGIVAIFPSIFGDLSYMIIVLSFYFCFYNSLLDCLA